MGQILSYFKARKREKANRRRRLKERLDAATACITQLEQQQLILHEKLQKHYVFYPERNDDINHRAVVFENEIGVLERKLFLEEIACDIAEERCNFLGKNLR
ncbi:PREDICTED: uncharacterized protein LOC107342756 [Acropora digitifera]|uniref:uncharacterized protein LOC107342756 n=1 Tax=Acropora digitifera TaxID=70779 RepID=UPI00077A2374|nr:PREDICTED: uncharacterized protein LOC107342756 [Acropora digitifera]